VAEATEATGAGEDVIRAVTTGMRFSSLTDSMLLKNFCCIFVEILYTITHTDMHQTNPTIAARICTSHFDCTGNV
jgi:hypothetical protein